MKRRECVNPIRKMRGALLCAIALPLVFLSGCKKEAAPETEVTVQAEHPEQGSIAEKIAADAVLAPLAQAAIEPKISAPVKKFYVERGARVKAGQLLATLENNDLAAAAMDSKGAYEAAQAAYATATKAQVPEDTLKAESDLAQAKANLELNQSIVQSRKQLLAEGAIPGRDLDTAQAALVQAQAAYDAAKQHLDSVHSVSRAAALQSAQGDLTSAEGKYQGAAHHGDGYLSADCQGAHCAESHTAVEDWQRGAGACARPRRSRCREGLAHQSRPRCRQHDGGSLDQSR
jgi:HlyD family secretion protein